jgi:hypothetical protein
MKTQEPESPQPIRPQDESPQGETMTVEQRWSVFDPGISVPTSTETPHAD